MNQVKVLFFASFRDYAGVRQAQVELAPESRVSDLKAVLVSTFPGLEKTMGFALLSVNREYAFDEDTIPDAAEIAVFPPVSGGSNHSSTICMITSDEIDLNNLLSDISSASTGAAVFFTGMVRGLTTRGDAHETEYLEYEAYTPMAEAKLRQVAEEIRQGWPSIEGIAIIQRVGRLDPHTPTVIIACTAAHRDTGVFEGARYGIDRLKEIVPVWKKEVGPGGEMWVEGKYIPGPHD